MQDGEMSEWQSLMHGIPGYEEASGPGISWRSAAPGVGLDF
jgi:hypothetical protein